MSKYTDDYARGDMKICDMHISTYDKTRIIRRIYSYIQCSIRGSGTSGRPDGYGTALGRVRSRADCVKWRRNFSWQVYLLLLLQYLRLFCEKALRTGERRGMVCELLSTDLPVEL